MDAENRLTLPEGRGFQGLDGKGEGIEKYKVLGWPKSPFSFFHQIKDIFFIFTNHFIAFDILSMSAVSCMVEC